MKKAFQSVVIARYMSEKDLAEFEEQYDAHRMRGRAVRISKQDEKLAADWKRGMTMRELAQKYKMKQTTVRSRIEAVAKASYRNS